MTTHHRHSIRRPRRLATATAAGLLIAASAAASTVSAAPGSASAHPAGRLGDCTQPGPYQLPHGSDPVTLDPAQFTTTITNPYFPMKPGTTWRFDETSGDGEVSKVTLTVTRRTKLIQGVTARVVHDSVRLDGELVEDTQDWYAQDAGGSLWYLGELSKTYEHGHVVSTEGSWTHGRNGAYAGVIIPANPQPGCSFREEYRAGLAQDQAAVLATNEPVTGPTGVYRNVLHTANTTPLEPGILENKFYAKGVGPILEVDISPDLGTVQLTGVSHHR